MKISQLFKMIETANIINGMSGNNPVCIILSTDREHKKLKNYRDFKKYLKEFYNDEAAVQIISKEMEELSAGYYCVTTNLSGNINSHFIEVSIEI